MYMDVSTCKWVQWNIIQLTKCYENVTSQWIGVFFVYNNFY